VDIIRSQNSFLDTCVLLDLETGKDNRLWHIGAIRSKEIFELKKISDINKALAELDRFVNGAAFILGHNILHHDLPILASLCPDLRLLRLPVVDTLYLSPLAFPQNPYHRLIKDYKLVRDSINNPVADARLAGNIFKDQWENFALFQKKTPEILPFYRFCFEQGQVGGTTQDNDGLSYVFRALGADCPGHEEAVTIWLKLTYGSACATALQEAALRYMDDPIMRPAMAYCLAWLRVAGGNSALPPWVRHRFNEIVPILKKLRDKPCGDKNCSYCRITHDPDRQLHDFFGYPEFLSLPDGRCLQKEIVIHCMQDRPLLAILPTGGGKSLCYQLPALNRYARRSVLTMVISPLQALMKDQVDNLTRKTDTNAAAAVYGMLTPPERGDVLEKVRLGDIGILYVSPEQLRNRSLKEAIKHREIGCWVFDEAHCLSKWGHDFRPDYLYAARFIKTFAAEQNMPVPPVACFTATANQDVITEIINHFKQTLGQELTLFAGGVERHNLHFEVHPVKQVEKYERVNDLLRERLDCHTGNGNSNSSKDGAIVYCATRKQTEACAEYLRRQGCRAEAFHAGLTAPRKRQIQEDFTSGVIPIICATNAFGMGIDKDNVRLIIHAHIPGSLENYIQEAGRAGRDDHEADCVLLYDEHDIETQFRFGAMSELSRRDIAQILRGLRRSRRNQDNEVIITAGELLRDEQVDTEFDSDDTQADTKVKTAIAWLERSGFVERNSNRTRVFQGKPVFRSMDEARARMDKLNLPPARRRQWEILIEALINSDPDQGMSADALAELPGVCQPVSSKLKYGKNETDTQRVLRILHDMAETGLIRKGILMTAYLRPKGRNNARRVLERICAIEKDMLDLMQQESPDADMDEWQHLSLRILNQRLNNLGHQDCNPAILKNLITSLAQDGKGLAGSRGSIELRYRSQDTYLVKLQRNWQSLIKTAELRNMVASAVLDVLYQQIPPDRQGTSEVLVDFASQDLVDAMSQHLFLASQVRDRLAAVDRGLMFLHEQKAIILQQGLAVFRQAMTISILPESRARRYTVGDYKPLASHYKERVFQIHVMNEYARLALEKISKALALVLSYFSLDRRGFIKRFFPGQKEMLDRAVSQDLYLRIVESVDNPLQEAVITCSLDDSVLVLAGPGSGKTLVVVHRCAFLLKVKRVSARNILILCFNHNAKLTLRKRLWQLVGPDSGFVTILTYHGLAMRLTGASFAVRAEEQSRDQADSRSRFDDLIPEALALLHGKKEIPGLAGDEIRERLLAGYQYILVDEYQDIDQDQYDLISALAGATLQDKDIKPALLAVGDDDQSIYGFRRASVRFIRQFAKDYQAETYHLVENYRSTRHIIDSANCLIHHNKDRMKTRYPIKINKVRENEPAGGLWHKHDPVSKGRVQIIEVEDVFQQAVAAAAEIRRLKGMNPQAQWSDFAVLARNGMKFKELSSLRALLEYDGIPVSWVLDRDKSFRLHRVREFDCFFHALKLRRQDLITADQLLEMANELVADTTPWQQTLIKLLETWKQESAGYERPVKEIKEFLFEALSEQQRGHRFGQGVFLSTVHAVKGLEFPHVFILDGNWSSRSNQAEAEEERRLYYVAMTRACHTLALFSRADCHNPHLAVLEGSCCIKRPAPAGNSYPSNIMQRRFEVLKINALFLDFAGVHPPGAPIHAGLAQLNAGNRMEFRLDKSRSGSENLFMCNTEGLVLARLSQKGGKQWKQRLDSVQETRVLAIVRRYSTDSQEKFRRDHRCEHWEVPIVEVIQE